MIARNVVTGDKVSPAVAAFDIAADKEPRLLSALDSDVVSGLPDNTTCWARVDGRSFQCRLVRVDSDSSSENRITIEAEFEDGLPRKHWNFDDVCELRLEAAEPPPGVPPGFRIPLAAMQHRGADWFVFVADESFDAATIRPVGVDVLETGIEFARVTGDLQPGEKIVSSGLHRIVPGQRVRVVAASGASTASGVGG